jgi:hypothetical protein
MCSQDEALPDRICSDLQSRGLAAPAAGLLAEQVAAGLVGQSEEDYARTLDSLVLGFRAQCSVGEHPSSREADLQEIERLMSSFAGELTKLDEVLEVLAAYLRRMRTACPGGSSTILH